MNSINNLLSELSKLEIYSSELSLSPEALSRLLSSLKKEAAISLLHALGDRQLSKKYADYRSINLPRS